VQVFDFGHVTPPTSSPWSTSRASTSCASAGGAKIGRRVPYGLSAYVVQQVAKGLDYAHRKTDEYGEELGIVHRDISPQNVLVSWDGAVKIVDFGIARARDVQEEEGVVKGKFAYMSPEQARGQPVDRRSDIYSAGHRALRAGLRPAAVRGQGQGGPRRGALRRHPAAAHRRSRVAAAARGDHAARPRLPPDDRYQTARDLQHALGRFQQTYAIGQGDLYDSGTLAQLVAQLVPRERRPRAGTAPVVPAAPEAQPTPESRRGTPAPSAPAAALTPGLAVGMAPAPESRERKHIMVVECELRGTTSPRARKAVADFLASADDVAYKHDAQPHRVHGADRGQALTYILGLPVSGDNDASRAHPARAGVGRPARRHRPRRRARAAPAPSGCSGRSALVTAAAAPRGPTRSRPARRRSPAALARDAQGGERCLVGGAVYQVTRGDWNSRGAARGRHARRGIARVRRGHHAPRASSGCAGPQGARPADARARRRPSSSWDASSSSRRCADAYRDRGRQPAQGTT
jgi:hypothetical protein